MIKWPKNYDEAKIKALTEKVKDTEFNSAQKIYYAFEHEDNIFIFRGILYDEWVNLDSNLMFNGQKISVKDIDESKLDSIVNKNICDICVVYGKEQLQNFPGLVMTIANKIFQISGFGALGETLEF